MRPAVGARAGVWSPGSWGHGDLIGCDAEGGGFEVEGGLWDRRTEEVGTSEGQTHGPGIHGLASEPTGATPRLPASGSPRHPGRPDFPREPGKDNPGIIPGLWVLRNLLIPPGRREERPRPARARS